jgi:hypothetical protein
MSKNTSETYFETALAPVTIRFSVKNAVAVTAAVIFTRAMIRGSVDVLLRVQKLRKDVEEDYKIRTKASQEEDKPCDCPEHLNDNPRYCLAGHPNAPKLKV